MSSLWPPGWVEATDPKTGRTYYANPSTRETRWDPPPTRVSSSAVPSSSRAHSGHRSGSGSGEHSGHGSGSGSRGRSGRKSGSGGSREVSNSSSGRGLSGNLLYTAPEVNEAIKTPAKLVPVAMAMLDKSAAFPEESVASDLELNSLTVGQIADLCKIQHATDACGENVAYAPLNPFCMSRDNPSQNMEEGRLDVRISALKRKLAAYVGEKDGSLND